jgi:hypothetical protein
MATSLPDLWSTRDLPVLRRIAHVVVVDNEAEARPEVVAAELGIETDDAVRSMVWLHDAGYVEALTADSMGGKYRLVTGLTERGRRVVGIWPSEDSVDALVDALDRAADEADDPEEESKLRKLATGFRNVSKKISTAVIAAYIAGQLPK